MFLLILFLLLLLALSFSYYIYRRAFCFKRILSTDPFNILRGRQYNHLQQEMRAMVQSTMDIPYEDAWTTSFDGLKLHARVYPTKEGAPVQILCHGYHGNPIRDFSGGIPLGLSEGFNVIAIDERAHCESEGKCLTFGILERRDVLTWVGYALERFGADTPIVLVGISMGAATVLMASNLPMPANVKGIMADCGYTSPVDIIAKVMRDMKLPPTPLMPFVRLGARLFGHFNLDEITAPEALSQTSLPVLLIHGEEDRFVPCEMSRRNYAACRSDATMFTVPGAAHGISYLIDYEGYVKAQRDFLNRILG